MRNPLLRLVIVLLAASLPWAAQPRPTHQPHNPSGPRPRRANLRDRAEKDEPGRITDVTVPTLTLYWAPLFGNTRVAVLVCPGGGYRFLSFEHEGTQVAQWLNSIGVNAILLKYRVPGARISQLSPRVAGCPASHEHYSQECDSLEY